MFNSAMTLSNRKRWLTGLTMALFVLVQFTAAAHAGVHAFHDDQSYCVALNSVESNDLLLPEAVDNLSSISAELTASMLQIQDVGTATFYSFHSRAPPLVTL